MDRPADNMTPRAAADPARPSGNAVEAVVDAAQQEPRLLAALVFLLGLALFLALPFVLSVGAVVFLPLTGALVLTVLLSPLADRLAGWGLPNVLASLLSLLLFMAVLILALALILQPAVALLGRFPAIVDQVGRRFSEFRDNFGWMTQLNDKLRALTADEAQQVVLATRSPLEELAFATPSVVLEVLLALLLTFFMIEARIRLRRHLMLGRADFGGSIKAARVVREVQDRVAAYIATVGLINAGVGIVVALGAWALGVEAPIMWGGLAALLNFLPYVGPLAMTVLLGLYGIGTAETITLGLIPAASYLALHGVEANVVTPSILGARFTVSPVAILISLSYFSWIWGFVGAILSVPILLMLTAFLDHVGRPNIIGFIFGEPLLAPAEPLAARVEETG